MSYDGRPYGGGTYHDQHRPAGGPSRGQGVRGHGRVHGNASHPSGVENGQTGAFACDVYLEDVQRRCAWRSQSEVGLQLHKADRHLIYPAGGVEEIQRIDPLLEEERREQAKRARNKRRPDDGEDEKPNTIVSGLNMALDTPELIERWIAERKKRWPTANVVQQKLAQSWDEEPVDRKGARQQQDQHRRGQTQARPMASQREADQSSSSDDSSDESSEGEEDAAKARTDKDEDVSDSSDNSDVDPYRDAVSSKIPPPELERKEQERSDQRPLCRFFQKGNCRHGEACSHRHSLDSSAQHKQSQQKQRKRPRAPSPNPFEAPHLLRALLQNEISQHANYVAQVVRFLVRNDYLKNVELQIGDAEEQMRKRNLIVDLSNDKEPASDTTQAAQSEPPLVAGALPIVDKGLYESPETLLRPISSLSLPPEPDQFALMDPLRALDAKPLTHEQYRQIAQDEGVRALLLDEDHGHPGKEENSGPSKGMIRALTTLDALPSLSHRCSAVEQILGVARQSALHAHQIGPTYVRSDRQASGSLGGSGGSSSSYSGSSFSASAPGRLISEQELFRLGLRVGVTEIQQIRQLAGRVSAVIGGPQFDVAENEPVDGQDVDQAIQPWWDANMRQTMREKHWRREGEWRDKMRKLGVDVD